MSRERVRVPEVDTAVHIVKGAIVKVFNAPVTVTTQCSKPDEGRITVMYSGAAPTAQQLADVQLAANERIAAGVDVVCQHMPRVEAEQRYKDGVNGTQIYDKFPVPDSVHEVQVVLIADWNINCCVGQHLKRTSDVRPIKAVRANYRQSKSELEIVFELGGPAVDAAAAAKAATPAVQAAAPSAAAAPLKSVSDSSVDDVHLVAAKLLERAFASLQLEPAALASAKASATPDVVATLTQLKNAAYARGFASQKGVATKIKYS
eukprot:TRINITY_DN10822_c0_g1_i1.p1 TRINITY_DN10822_c0_g1~~TRINITY_DN10822_c0_g1_i1.p1  ORF type:complete len:262 (-),score=91.21 TRINITY_DN10822_c0_g1_i1:44-829(-)